MYVRIAPLKKRERSGLGDAAQVCLGASRQFLTLEENTWNWESHFLLQPRTLQPRALFALLRRPNAWAITQCGPMSAYCIPLQASHSLMGQRGSSLSPISQSTSQLRRSALSRPVPNASSWGQAL